MNLHRKQGRGTYAPSVCEDVALQAAAPQSQTMNPLCSCVHVTSQKIASGAQHTAHRSPSRQKHLLSKLPCGVCKIPFQSNCTTAMQQVKIFQNRSTAHVCTSAMQASTGTQSPTCRGQEKWHIQANGKTLLHTSWMSSKAEYATRRAMSWPPKGFCQPSMLFQLPHHRTQGHQRTDSAGMQDAPAEPIPHIMIHRQLRASAQTQPAPGMKRSQAFTWHTTLPLSRHQQLTQRD